MNNNMFICLAILIILLITKHDSQPLFFVMFQTSILLLAESNCVHILQHDGVSAISAAMRHHSENAEIVKLLFRTVAFISTAGLCAKQLVFLCDYGFL